MSEHSSQAFDLDNLFIPNSAPTMTGPPQVVSTKEGNGASTKRGKTGCITCRLRKKRCDEAKPICATCSRLGIECMGYGVKRPKWLKENDNAKKTKQTIKKIVLSRRSQKNKISHLEQHTVDNSNSNPDPTSIPVDLGDDGDADEDQDGQTRMDADEQAIPHFWDMGPSPKDANTISTNSISNHDILPWNLPLTTSHNPIPEDANTIQSTTNFLQPMSIPNPSYPVSGYLADPSIFPPVTTSVPIIPGDMNSMNMNSLIPGGVPSLNDMSMEALLGFLFGPPVPPGFVLDPNTNSNIPQAPAQVPQNSIDQAMSLTPFFNIPSATPTPSPSPTASPFPNLTYLHHYLNVVLPLQYRIIGITITMGDFVGSLALRCNEVLTSVSSLAALHMVAQRSKKRLAKIEEETASVEEDEEQGEGKGSSQVRNRFTSLDEDDEDDDDVKVAITSHRKTLERLRFISSKDLVAEEIILSVCFAISYNVFCGGTSKKLKELISISRRCLSAALYSSPELGLTGNSSKNTNIPGSSPWSKYPILLESMIWIDIISSVTYNKASTLLPMYRKLLSHMPYDQFGNNGKPLVLMDKMMGCDSTTLLAMCETVALSEWKEKAEFVGCLSYKELLERSSKIEKLLDERSWRESHLDINSFSFSSTSPTSLSGNDGQTKAMEGELRRVMSDVFYGSVKVLLAVTVNGPYPRVPEIASAVVETIEALNRLDIQQQSNVQIHRAVVLPITIAGCHCETEEQQAFFRNCFAALGHEAKAFGNTGSALELMEQVWKKRSAGIERVDWRETMYELGWKSGILLI
ncbi:hypothetical protein L486_03378 [Kwoniella mangroviensis CBS 10435]|uniref:Zn(2)-C6 fungal-type domain-containing protein n=1 Tax=Kwoniella mangroviensis CBS 10435 TaxID=1331196 RepID=A0A1B9ITM8_9TREE|nr:hypothetical protein L486_03378 [Kwoniella mangroviensis CBS 10435]